MVEGPDLDKAVFVRCLGIPKSGRGYGEVDLSDDGMDERDAQDSYKSLDVSCGFTSSTTSSDPDKRGLRSAGGENTIQMRRDDIWIVRWRSVRQAVARGECELL